MMAVRRIRFGVIAVCVGALVSATWAGGAEAGKAFTDGKTLLAKGDFDGALKAYKAAAQADPENKEYLQEFSLLRRVVKMRAELASEKDAEAWQQMARALFVFYCDHKLSGEALAVAGTVHEKLGTGESAEMLADAQLDAGKPADAVKLLGDLSKDKQTPRCAVLQGIALARGGKQGEAKAAAEKLTLPKDVDPRLYFDAARLYALTGSTDKTLGTLKSSFEYTPPGALEAMRTEAKECKDFAAVSGGEEFGKVLKTESKVKEGCGSKDACGKCPLKDKHGKAGDKKDAGCPEHQKADKGSEKEADKKPDKP
jgi:tetratricopeptide (TPR) repeat protein